VGKQRNYKAERNSKIRDHANGCECKWIVIQIEYNVGSLTIPLLVAVLATDRNAALQ